MRKRYLESMEIAIDRRIGINSSSLKRMTKVRITFLHHFLLFSVFLVYVCSSSRLRENLEQRSETAKVFHINNNKSEINEKSI